MTAVHMTASLVGQSERLGAMHPVEVVMLVRALLKAASALAALCGRRGRQNMQNKRGSCVWI